MTDDKDDLNLFREHLKDVVERRPDTVEPHRRRPPAVPRQTWKAEAAVLEEMAGGAIPIEEIETGEELVFRREGIQLSTLRRLRRGQYAVQGELDLHGRRADEARADVAGFIRHAQQSGWTCVRIIHGKGQGSFGGQPVIKPKLARWLARHGDVLAYASARPIDGGTGAVYVLLRRS